MRSYGWMANAMSERTVDAVCYLPRIAIDAAVAAAIVARHGFLVVYVTLICLRGSSAYLSCLMM